jgi:hypothetical protein
LCGLWPCLEDRIGVFCQRKRWQLWQAIPRNGCFFHFGERWIYVATAHVRRFPDVVHVAADPPVLCTAHGQCIDRLASFVEVMMAGAGAGAGVDAGKGVAGDKYDAMKSARPSMPAYRGSRTSTVMSAHLARPLL